MRKTLLVASASIFGICVLVIAAKAATTWQGPPINCTSPEGSNCNTNGVIWNQTTQQSPANFNVSGNGQTGGSLTAGTGLIVNSGGANITGSTRIINSDTRITNGDLYFETDSKAIHVDQAGTAHLLIGNWTAVPNTSNVEVTIFGDLKVDVQAGKAYAPKMTTPTLCLNGDCRSAWPAVGGGGDITGVTAGTGLSGGGMNGDVTLNVAASYQMPQACAANQIPKWNGLAWACAADGGGAGTVTSITAANGITATPNPITGVGTIGTNIGSGLKYFGAGQIIIDNTFSGFDTKYILKNQNDTTSGTITISSAGNYGLDSTGILSGVMGRGSGNGMGVYGWGSGTGVGVYGYAPNSSGVYGYGSTGVEGYGTRGGYFTGTSGYYSQLGTASYGVYGYGPTYLGGGNVTVQPGYSLCLNGSCKAAWEMPTGCAANQIAKWNGAAWTCAADATGGTGDVTDVLAGTGVTVTNSGGPQPTINVVDNYVNTTGDDTMSGSLTVNGNLGVGATPGYKLDVNGRARMRGNAGLSAGTWYYNTGDSTDQIFVGVINYDAATIANRNWGIWYNTWNYQFKADGTAYKQGGANTWSITSDGRLKKNIKPLTNALDKLSKLDAVNFEWINEKEHFASGVQGGFIAQNVEKYFPSWVTEVEPSSKDAQLIKDGDKAKSLALPLEFDALVVESIKELKTQNDMLQAENDMLLHRIEALEAKVK